MTAQDGLFTGQLNTTTNTQAVAFSIKDLNEEKADDGDGKGYKTLCYEQATGKPAFSTQTPFKAAGAHYIPVF
ncbi:MAG: hypothetical protein R2788_23580 [Saprospiraceae bacterium]